MTPLEIVVVVVGFILVVGLAFALDEWRRRDGSRQRFANEVLLDSGKTMIVDFIKTAEDQIEGYWQAGDRQLRRYRVLAASTGRVSWPRDRRRRIRAAMEAAAREVEAIPWRWPTKPRTWTMTDEELILR